MTRAGVQPNKKGNVTAQDESTLLQIRPGAIGEELEIAQNTDVDLINTDSSAPLQELSLFCT